MLLDINVDRHRGTKRMRQSLISSADTCMLRVKFGTSGDFPYHGGVLRARGTGMHAGYAYYYTERMLTGLMPEITPEFIEKTVDVSVKAFDMEMWRTRMQSNEMPSEEEIEAFKVEWLANPPAEDPFSWMYQAKNYRADLITWDYEMAVEWIEQSITDYLTNSWFWPAQYMVVGVEQGFSLDLPGATEEWARTGTVDLLLFDTLSKWYVLVDHKSAKKKWAKNKSDASATPQASYYVGAWQEILGTKSVKFVYDVYSDDRLFERRDAYRTEVQISLTKERAASLATIIDNDGPFWPNPASFLCSENWCDYWDACDYGKAFH